MLARYGKEGLQELQRLDAMTMSATYRLYLVSSTAANLHVFDPDLAKEFYNKNTKQINLLMSDIDHFTQEFNKKRGEI